MTKPIMYMLILESNDVLDPEFVAYLVLNRIAPLATGKVSNTPGGGAEIKYLCETREPLEAMYRDQFACGDPEVDNEAINSIVAIA